MPTTTTLLPFLSAPCLATSASFLIAAARNSCFLPILRHGLKNSWERVKEGKKSVLYKFPKKSIPRFRILCRFLPVDAAFPPSFSPLLAFCGFFTLLLLLAAKNLCFSCKLAAAAAKTQARNRAWLSVGATTHEVYEPLLPPPPFPGNPRGLNATAEEEEGEDLEIRHVCCRNSIPVLLSDIFLFWTSANPSSCPAKLILRHTRTV